MKFNISFVVERDTSGVVQYDLIQDEKVLNHADDTYLMCPLDWTDLSVQCDVLDQISIELQLYIMPETEVVANLVASLSHS